MIKKVLFVAMVAALVVSCDSEKKRENKRSDDKGVVETSMEKKDVEQNVVNEPTSNPDASGDIVYVDMAYLSAQCKLSLTEGKDLDTKLEAYEAELKRANDAWMAKEQALQAEAAKIQDDYQKTLITSITFQQKGEDLQRRYAEFQNSVQNEAGKLAQQEQALAEEQMVLGTRFTTLLKKAVENVNSQGQYKMVVTSDVLIDADESLNISALVLAEMDKLYDEGALN